MAVLVAVAHFFAVAAAKASFEDTDFCQRNTTRTGVIKTALPAPIEVTIVSVVCSINTTTSAFNTLFCAAVPRLRVWTPEANEPGTKTRRGV